jgi:hypothetical protein
MIIILVWQIYGTYELVDEHHPSVFAYTRTHGGEIYLVVLNFFNEYVEWEIPIQYRGPLSVIITNSACVLSYQELVTKVQLGPYDGVIFRQEGSRIAHRGSPSDSL